MINRINARSYNDATDLEPVLGVLSATVNQRALAEYPSVEDMREKLLLSTTHTAENVRIWQADPDQTVGFALFQLGYNNLLFFTRPGLAEEAEIQSQMIAWGVERMQAMNRVNGTSETLDTFVRTDDAARLRLIERHGFKPLNTQTYRMSRSLLDPIPEPTLPPGFTLHTLAGEHEIDQFVALHREAFGTQHATAEQNLFFMRSEGYRPELDLIAVAPDGTWAAFCTGWIDEASSARNGRLVGWTDPIGTRPAYRKLGLAKNLILTCFQRLEALGVETALLGTSSLNTQAVSVYESVGYTILYRVDWFGKQV